MIGDGSGGQWINCGTYNSSFHYIGLAAIDDNSWSANIYIDAVMVI
ncbi:MAG: hypothetical protein FWC14_00800 [Candidatus Bathyarchaeota archaeon]|nr:hypothetical protein [Candidatus Termiticorpusculum sp.]